MLLKENECFTSVPEFSLISGDTTSGFCLTWWWLQLAAFLYNFDNATLIVLGNLAMVTGGHNLGRVGTITHREKHPGSFDIVHIKDTLGHSFATRWVLLLYFCMLSTFSASNPPTPTPPTKEKWIDSVLTSVLPAILPPLPSTKKQIDSVSTEYRCRMLLLLLNLWNAFMVKCRTTTCEMQSYSNAEEPSPVKCRCVQMQENLLQLSIMPWISSVPVYASGKGGDACIGELLPVCCFFPHALFVLVFYFNQQVFQFIPHQGSRSL